MDLEVRNIVEVKEEMPDPKDVIFYHGNQFLSEGIKKEEKMLK